MIDLKTCENLDTSIPINNLGHNWIKFLVMSGQDTSLLEQHLREQLAKLYELTEENGLAIYPVFNALPPRDVNSEYYEMIKNPVSLMDLKNRISNYKTAQDFLNDLAQIPWNAKLYNAKGSLIHKCAVVLENFIKKETVGSLRSYYPHVKYPFLGKLPDEILEKIAIRSKQPQSMQSQSIDQTHNLPSNLNFTTTNMTRATTSSLPAVISKLPSNTQVPVNTEIANGMKCNPSILAPSNITQTPEISSNGLSKTSLPSNSLQRTHLRRGRPPTVDLPFMFRIKNILKYLKREEDDKSRSLSSSFDRLPEETEHPSYYNIIKKPMSLDMIYKKVRTRKYKNFDTFREDINLMLENYRTYYGSDIKKLQLADMFESRFKVFVSVELNKPDSEFLQDGELRYPLDSVTINDTKYSIGDWVFLKNPNDPKKPTVGQIFKLWSTSDGKKMLNACWYLRPEQTVHRVDRLFYKNEVVKSGQYRDHVLEDLEGKCYVIHFTRFQRGDPAVKHEGPLFVCEYRYNENDKVFNKIRTWKACLPEELRDYDEPTIPVAGRKFFKYPSPIRHLLKPGAEFTDDPPQPTEGAPNAPPLVGGVYLRPKQLKDDLGEYSTSDECPRYIIRPGDPVEKGEVNEQTGTIRSVTPIANTPLKSNSTVRLASLKSSKESSPANSSNNSTSTRGRPSNASLNKSRLTAIIDKQKVPEKRKNKMPIEKKQKQQRSSIQEILSNLEANNTKHHQGQIVVDSPGAFVLESENESPELKNLKLLQYTDASNDVRRLGRGKVTNSSKFDGELLLFRGPSVSIQERVLNSHAKKLGSRLNQWNLPLEKLNLEFDEIEEELSGKSGTSNDNEGSKNTAKFDTDSITMDCTTFDASLYPSATYVAHRLRLGNT